MAALRLDESDGDAILPVSIGTAIWAVVLVVLLAMRSTLDANGTAWWVWAASVGVVSGLGGLVFLTWRKRRMVRRAIQE
jgi:protein-S-isoprenylcysteine O-methyltransferase Ste14